MEFQIVLISGKQGSGKTTLAKKLMMDMHGSQNVTRVILMNFADPIKEMHDFCLGVLAHAGIVRDIVKDGPLMQLLGTEWGRKVDPDLWVKMLKGRLDRNLAKMGNLFKRYVVIVGDCRFENEVNFLPEALRVRLECPRDIRKERCEAWRENEYHASETSLDEYSITGKFDLTFNTGVESVEHCATMINAQLFKKSWLEKRTKFIRR